MAERPSAADVLRPLCCSLGTSTCSSPSCRAMAEKWVDKLRAAVGATGNDIVCLLPDGTLTVAERVFTMPAVRSVWAGGDGCYHIPGAAS